MLVAFIRWFINFLKDTYKIFVFHFYQLMKNLDKMSEDGTEKEEFTGRRLDDSKLTEGMIPEIMRRRIYKDADLTPGRRNLKKWLGKTFRVVISDGRVLIGFFNCTDKDANLVLSMCAEYLEEGKEARMLGNVMVPGKHIVSISVDEPTDETLET